MPRRSSRCSSAVVPTCDPHGLPAGRRRCHGDRRRRVGERRPRGGGRRGPARPPLDRRRLRRSQGGRVRRGDAPALHGLRRAKAAAEGRVVGRTPDALIVRTSLIVGGPGHEPSKHELRPRIPARRSTTTRYGRRCRLATSPRGARAGRARRLRAARRAGADDVSRAELAELWLGGAVRRAPAPPGRPLDCSLDSSRARACSARSCAACVGCSHEPPRRRDEPVPPPARRQPGGLVPLGRGGARARARARTGRSCSRSATAPATGAT